jgi:hypothetical protein
MIDDEVVQLREWGTEVVHVLPAAGGAIAIGDHARLAREHGTWIFTDGGAHDVETDGAPSFAFPLLPGVRIGLGARQLVAESARFVELRAFVARVFGWTQPAAVDAAVQAIRASPRLGAPLGLQGAIGDVVAVAQQLHRRVLDGARPFVVVGRRRRSDRTELDAAIRAAAGGTLCVWLPSLRPDADDLSARLASAPAVARVVIGVPARAPVVLALSALAIPALSARAHELPAIVDGYGADAIARLGARPTSYTAADRAWILARAPRSLGDLETTALRRVAIRDAGSVTAAAARLGVTHSALSRWLARRLWR